jgi:hypothetical protein
MSERVTEVDRNRLAGIYDGTMIRYDSRIGAEAVSSEWKLQLTLRIWDGMDGCWSDVATGDAETMMRLWYERTQGGTKNTNFHDIDYYRLFPADTRMAFDGGIGREMFRDEEGR